MSINIFLSSPRKGLEGIREALIREIDKFNPFLNVIAMEKNEFWESHPSQKVSIENLKESNIYILLIGDRYGTVIENCEIEDCPLRGKECNGGISYTHCEYRFAKAMGIPRLCLRIRIKDNKKEDEKMLGEFIEEVKKFDTPKYITAKTPDEAIEKVVKEIRGILPKNILPKKIVEWYKNDELKIPMFFGRGEELSRIWNKFKSGGVLYITGVGGIEKTSLAEVLLILKAIEGWRVFGVYRKGSYTGYKLFNDLANKNELKDVIKKIVLNLDSLTYTELCEKLAGIKGKIDYDNLIEILDEENVILLLDDLQFADDDVKEFVKRCEEKLSKSAIIVTSRRFEETNRVEIKGIEKDYNSYVKYLADKYSVSIDDSKIEEIRELSRGHPILTEIIVRNYHKCELSKISEISKTPSDDDFVNEFLKRLIEENIKGQSLDFLRKLSVFRREVGKSILEILKVDGKIIRDLIDWLMLRRVKGGYTFYDDVIKECVFGMLSEEEKLKAHEKAVEYYKSFYEKCVKGRSKDLISIVFEYIYHLVECKKFEEAWKVVVDQKTFDDLRGNVNFEEFVRVLEKIHGNLYGYKRDKTALMIGRVYQDLGQFKKAVEFLESLEHVEGTDKVEKYELLSFAYVRLSKTIDALKNILKAVTIIEDEKELKRLLWSYGATNWYLSNFVVSVRNYEKSFDVYTHGRVYYSIGDAYIRLGNLYESYESFDKGLNESRDRLESAFNSLGKGCVLTLLGKYKNAIEELKNSKRDFLNMKHFFSPDSYICMGVYYHIQEKLDDARKNYEDGLRISTHDYYTRAVARHNLGILYTDLDIGDAEKCLREAEEIFNRYGFAYGRAKVLHHLGVIEELRVNYEKAEEYYKESLKLKEDLTRENRKKIEKMINEDSEFREIVGEARKRGIDVVKDFEKRNVDKLGRAVTLAQLGVLKFKEGEKKEALKNLRNARKKFEEIFGDLMLEFNVTSNENPYLKLVNQAIDGIFKGKASNIIFRDFMIP